MKHGTLRALLMLATLTLASCMAEYDDVSKTAEHREVVGELCSIQTSLNAFGVTRKLEREKKTDLIVLTTLNLSGPEITFSAKLPSLTKLEIITVRKCRNCPFERVVEYQVQVQPVPVGFGSSPTYMNLNRIEPSALTCKTLRGSWSAP
jgi:hypothetical protein